MLKRIGIFFLDILEVIVFAIAIFLFVYLLLLQPHKIKGDSMQPNFPNGEYLLTDKVSYRFREPKRGEVIVFEAPQSEGDEFIKRIIGLPGELVSIKEGSIFINEKKLNEGYLASGAVTLSGNFFKEAEEIVVPEELYFVLGDNRLHSSDSRAWGFVPKDKITGRAWVIYWPVAKAGPVQEVNYSF
ncbi:signal peptidase I [Candidatus Woesebacteria bacterium GWA1_41_8]|uniref:Signal peptidase I n=1 Tax=Candidatus Woesebacteria bacterium GWA1_41_8 TaxID=1802471 RepID=A0A1F7WI79_9BACT|nr:MAG: signal peptidase I [Candidatus Woesebacteria bacterium GWA1_41_8]